MLVFSTSSHAVSAVMLQSADLYTGHLDILSFYSLLYRASFHFAHIKWPALKVELERQAYVAYS